VGWSAEGGVAKVMAELGLPGVALLAWLTLSLAKYLWLIVRHARGMNFARASLTYGLVAILVANAFVFITAHQIFGDLFVLSLLGFFMGFVLAAPRMNAARITSPNAKMSVLKPSSDWPPAQGAS
jgi:hypothetical protein